MHRPVIDWKKNKNIDRRVLLNKEFSAQKLLDIRKITGVADKKSYMGHKRTIFMCRLFKSLW
jgi:hypothetical protein